VRRRVRNGYFGVRQPASCRGRRVCTDSDKGGHLDGRRVLIENFETRQDNRREAPNPTVKTPAPCGRRVRTLRQRTR
jgi:hypothetical protein